MEALLEKLGWKKFAILVVGVTLIFLVLFISAFSASGKPGVSSISNSSNRTENNGGNSAENISLNKNYSSEFYSINYHDNFDLKVLTVSPPILDNIELSDGNTSSNLQIVVFDREGNTVDSLSVPYQNDNFTGKVIEKDNNYGFYFEGKLSENVYQKVSIIQKGFSIIRFSLTYVGDRNSTLERQFDEIFESLK